MALDLVESERARGLPSPVVIESRSIARVVGIVVVLLTVPIAVVLFVAGHVPVTGIVVSGVLLFAVVLLLVPPRAGSG